METRSIMKPCLRLSGLDSFDEQRKYMGLYCQKFNQKDAGAVYQHIENNLHMWWFPRKKQWVLGNEKDIGRDKGFICTTSVASNTSPIEYKGAWNIYYNGSWSTTKKLVCKQYLNKKMDCHKKIQQTNSCVGKKDCISTSTLEDNKNYITGEGIYPFGTAMEKSCRMSNTAEQMQTLQFLWFDDQSNEKSISLLHKILPNISQCLLKLLVRYCQTPLTWEPPEWDDIDITDNGTSLFCPDTSCHSGYAINGAQIFSKGKVRYRITVTERGSSMYTSLKTGIRVVQTSNDDKNKYIPMFNNAIKGEEIIITSDESTLDVEVDCDEKNVTFIVAGQPETIEFPKSMCGKPLHVIIWPSFEFRYTFSIPVS